MAAAKSKEKIRLDKLLVERELAPSRAKAEALILAGQVCVNGEVETKAGTNVAVDVQLELKQGSSQYVGRGGDKIAPVLEQFAVNLVEAVVLDVGASTGGFTDVVLRGGAKRVYAVDVGHNQLNFRLREDERVVVMERTNAKDLTSDMFDPRPSFAVIDVSFIGLRKVLEPVVSVLAEGGSVLALVKPQFELEPEYVAKGGVVRKVEDQQRAVDLVEQYAQSLGLRVIGSVPAPIKGGKKGNQEYFVYLQM